MLRHSVSFPRRSRRDRPVRISAAEGTRYRRHPGARRPREDPSLARESGQAPGLHLYKYHSSHRNFEDTIVRHYSLHRNSVIHPPELGHSYHHQNRLPRHRNTHQDCSDYNQNPKQLLHVQWYRNIHPVLRHIHCEDNLFHIFC